MEKYIWNVEYWGNGENQFTEHFSSRKKAENHLNSIHYEFVKEITSGTTIWVKDSSTVFLYKELLR